jgi:2-iminobutanoate/2-iminopropanoate deaminase
MSIRRTFELPGIGHGSNPIPMAAQVGSVFRTSGIPPTDPLTGQVPADGADQIAMAFANAGRLLAVAGLSSANVVYMDIFLADDRLRPDLNKEWLLWYPDPDDRPARHVVLGPLLGRKLVQLQIQAVDTR